MKLVTLAFIVALAIGGCGKDNDTSTDKKPDIEKVYPPSVIGFGSCSDPILPMPVLGIAAAMAPEIFIFMGDNVYADTQDMSIMQADYDALANTAEFQQIRAVSTLLATWDDHDYGENDVGKNYPMKAESEQIFLDFWDEPADSERRQHEGIYHAWLYEGDPGPNLQIIVLDTRYFRDDLTPNDGSGKNDYMPNSNSDLDLLGAAQWTWLQAQLNVEAEVRIIVSSIQFAHEYNGWESWTNLPAERERMLELIRTTEAEGVLMLSGDVHWGEISQIEVAPGYMLVDATSSAINRFPDNPEDNTNRIGSAFKPNNFGMLTIDWEAETIAVSIIDVTSTERIGHTIAFDDMRF